MTKNLKELKSRLYEAFDKAFEKAGYSYGDKQPDYMVAAAKTAEAIVAVEHELAEQESVRARIAKIKGLDLSS